MLSSFGRSTVAPWPPGDDGKALHAGLKEDHGSWGTFRGCMDQQPRMCVSIQSGLCVLDKSRSRLLAASPGM